VALVISPSGETVTWAELRRRIVQAANALHDLGRAAG
jgi:acyl-CoA synthetase (AMP-forming)/AMP-acid ligase II